MSSGTPTIELEITSGKALCKRRLVGGSVFLIGTSPECDLVLAADGLPEVCAIVTAGSDAVAIRAVGEEAELTVNGRALGLAHLVDGDRLRIGPFEFTVRIRSACIDTRPFERVQHPAAARRWTHDGEPVDVAAMCVASRLRFDIRAAIANEQRILRRPA